MLVARQMKMKSGSGILANKTVCATFAPKFEQNESKSKDNMTKSKPETQGLYQSDYEHDACGVGMVVNIHGGKSHELVDNALKVLENMEHRGAETRDKTGDGAGIMVQIPHEFILLQGIPVPEKGKYGTGLVFLPKEEKEQQEILSVMIEEIEREGLTLMHLRTVPTCPEVLGAAAREVEPDIKQVFIATPQPLSKGGEFGYSRDDEATFSRKLYIIRKRIERRVAHPLLHDRRDFSDVAQCLAAKHALAGLHPSAVAADGVDLAVVGQQAERLSQ